MRQMTWFSEADAAQFHVFYKTRPLANGGGKLPVSGRLPSLGRECHFHFHLGKVLPWFELEQMPTGPMIPFATVRSRQ
jgi:hypothetical protein